MEPLVQQIVNLHRPTFVGVVPKGQKGIRGGATFGAQSLPEGETLQKALESEASEAEIKAAMDKYVAACKTRHAELEKAQNDLRGVLTTRQEAITTLDGLLQ